MVAQPRDNLGTGGAALWWNASCSWRCGEDVSPRHVSHVVELGCGEVECGLVGCAVGVLCVVDLILIGLSVRVGVSVLYLLWLRGRYGLLV